MITSEDKNVATWLSQRQLIHSIGAYYNRNINQNMLLQSPIYSYDGLIFIKKTSAAVGIKGNETSINDGDSFIRNYNIKKYISTIVLILILISAISIFIYRKIKNSSGNNISEI